MYDVKDTIIAVSSPSSNERVIIRISGSDAIAKLNQFFKPSVCQEQPGIIHGKISPADGLEIDAAVYLFISGHSYTNELLAEIHLYTNSSVTEALIERFLACGVRLASPGEFTARAYLNGKMDLSQAEAVNKIITGGNRFQLDAAQKLLQGRLTSTVSTASRQMLDCLSLIEAGLDFSQEDINFISSDEASKRLAEIKKNLQELLDGSVSYENVLDLPAVGIAGASNAGKSSLLNALLGQDRSIVSEQPKTTRDILSGILELENCRCVIFDCAGLLAQPYGRIDELAQQAALRAIESAELTIFCVDAAKEFFDEDIAIRNLVSPKKIIAVAAKCDLLKKDRLNEKLGFLKQKFDTDFLPTSSKTAFGLDKLKKRIETIIAQSAQSRNESQRTFVALTARHKHSISEAIENLNSAVVQIMNGNNEVAAMMLRAAIQAVSGISREHIDEKILDKIFGEFCIGK